jgi:hypothetical protein
MRIELNISNFSDAEAIARKLRELAELAEIPQVEFDPWCERRIASALEGQGFSDERLVMRRLSAVQPIVTNVWPTVRTNAIAGDEPLRGLK